MMSFTTIIPTSRNNGRPVSRREMATILVELVDQFGGYTAEGVTKGAWRDERTGHVYHDRGRKITIACDRERLPEAIDAVKAIGRRLGQEAMWFEVRGADGVSILNIE
jgi:hypothetical protein